MACIKRETLFFPDDTGYHISPTEVIKTRRVQREVEMAEPTRAFLFLVLNFFTKKFVHEGGEREKGKKNNFFFHSVDLGEKKSALTL